MVFFGLIIVLLIVLAAAAGQASKQQTTGSAKNLPEAVEIYRESVRSIASEYEMEEFTDVLLAVMAYETGGVGLDPMNASTSSFNKNYPQVSGGIKLPAYSIRVAVETFKYHSELAGLETVGNLPLLKLVIQAYNFGGSYIPWAIENYNEYSLENAKEFSELRAQQNGVLEYGDSNYVPNVLNYYRTGIENEDGTIGGEVTGTGTFLWPVPGFSQITTNFNDPDPNGTPHRGMDIVGPFSGAITGADIIAADGGFVSVATYNHSSYGNYLQIDHGNGYKTLYAHCIGLNVRVGQYVSAGEVIAFVGSTGFSTGPHLHFEVLYNGLLIDPRTVL